MVVKTLNRMSMKIARPLKTFLIGAVCSVAAAFTSHHDGLPAIDMPYKKAGLTKEQAAAHLISRFSFGARPGDIDAVVKQGLDHWLLQQLSASDADDSLKSRLAGYDALDLSTETIVNTYLTPAQVIRVGIREKIFDKDSIKNTDQQVYREQLRKIQEVKGLKPIQELHRQLINQKVLRAAYSNNQLQEVMTDFWFNHFNVSLTKGQDQQLVLTYERDAIRPYVLGQFKDMLLATAKHPAMLEYLDNALSVSNDNERARRQMDNAMLRAAREKAEAMTDDTTMPGSKILKQALAARKTQGLNENYAREVMELHTLGVDGGYTQKDVTEVARALTGWSVRPMFKDGPAVRLLDNLTPVQMERRGLKVDGDFLFRGDKHDDSEKTILGKKYPAKGGYEEGVQVLEMLAEQHATAVFISTKLAKRFVSDNPPAALINAMAASFEKTKGNIKAVLITLVNHPAFWSKEALREKVKSPFELAISAIRATNAEVMQPFQVYTWCAKMGQRFYYYQAPTGFPDKASYWINTGSLLNRMNFGLAFATQKIPGIKINLSALNDNHEPESAEAALRIYSKLLLPERDQEENIKRLTAMIQDEGLVQKISEAAEKNKLSTDVDMGDGNEMMMEGGKRKNEKAALSKKNNAAINTRMVAGTNNTVSQVVGIIIGSPEFQRK